MKDYVRARQQSTRETFVRLHHPPSHAQVDFGEATVETEGRREKVAFFCLILPHSYIWLGDPSSVVSRRYMNKVVVVW